MNQIFRTLQNVSGSRAYTPAELTVTEFLAEQGFYGTDGTDYGPEPPSPGGIIEDPDDDDDWGGGGPYEGPETPTIGGV